MYTNDMDRITELTLKLTMELESQLLRPIKYYRHWRYKNTGLLLVSIATLIYFAGHPYVGSAVAAIGSLGYVGAFFTGILFTSTFTVTPAMVLLYHLASQLPPLHVALIAGLGAVLGDYIIFRFLKDRFFDELKPLFKHLGGSHVSALFATPYFGWLLPLVGAALIASPGPDELGIGILGLSKLKNWQFVLLTFILHASGVFIVVTLARSF